VRAAFEALVLTPSLPTRSLSLAESAAAKISELIVSGELQPGMRLPAERQLASILGVSRSALREGLHVLESAGLLEATVGRGRFVTDAATAQSPPSIFAWMQLHHTRDVIAVRRVLEPQAVLELDPSSLDILRSQMERELRQIEQAQRKGAHLVAADHHQQFHALLIQGTPNRLIRSLCLSMLEVSRESQYRIARTKSAAQHSLRQHKLIVEALARNDLSAAARRVADHLVPVFAYPDSSNE
jgi:GntR family transcriptional repressor for pyruvate dehydrogenase complex